MRKSLSPSTSQFGLGPGRERGLRTQVHGRTGKKEGDGRGEEHIMMREPDDGFDKAEVASFCLALLLGLEEIFRGRTT